MINNFTKMSNFNFEISWRNCIRYGNKGLHSRLSIHKKSVNFSQQKVMLWLFNSNSFCSWNWQPLSMQKYHFVEIFFSFCQLTRFVCDFDFHFLLYKWVWDVKCLRTLMKILNFYIYISNVLHTYSFFK